MEKIDTARYILIGLVCLFSFLANLSTDHVRRRQFYVGAFIAALAFFSTSALSRSRPDFLRTWIVTYNFFAGIGLILPQFISRILVRQKMKHPVIFLKKKKIPFIVVVVVGMFGVLMAWVALSPKEYSFTAGGPVYDEFYVLSSFSFLVFFIPLILFSIHMLVERDAICENGFYQGGLLSDWSNFKSYFWSPGELYADPEIQPFLNKNTLVELTIEPKRKFFGRSIQLIIPFDEKKDIDNLLSRKPNMQLTATQQGDTRTTTA